MQMWVITTEALPVEVLGAEKVSSDRADEYTARLRRLVREKKATFLGRAMEESTGQVFQMFNLEGVGGAPDRTVYVQDRQATRIVSTLVEGQAKVRRLVIKGLGATPE